MNSTSLVASTSTMKAVVSRHYGPPESLTVDSIPRPVAGPAEVLIRNHASVVTAAVVEARRGLPLARLYFGLTGPKWPVLGTNFSGVVEAVGDSVTRFAVGDRVAGVKVAGFGAHAQYLAVDQDAVIALAPTGLTDSEAVAVFDGAITALPFLRDGARLASGQTILINGAAGAIGSAAIQLAKHFGAHVTAVCSAGNLDTVRSLGADVAIDYATEDFTRARDRYDVVFDTVAKSSFLRSRRSLTRDGIYLTTVPSPVILAQMAFTSRFGRRKAAILFTGLAKPEAMARDLVTIGDLAQRGIVVPVIGAVHAMEDAAQAHRLVQSGHKRGSAVLTF